VAQDGRVIGLEVEDSFENDSAGVDVDSQPHAVPFFRGISANEIIQALTDFECRRSANFEGIDPPDKIPGEIGQVLYEP
jgi:hypothetical protein